MSRAKKTICKSCHNQGYTVEIKGQFAFAKACDCILNCAVCNGEGFQLSKNDNNYDYMTPCAVCEPARHKIRKYNKAEIPAKYHDKLQSDSLKPLNKSVANALTYAKESFVDKYPYNRGFILMGPSGV